LPIVAVKARALPPRKNYLAETYSRILQHRTVVVFQANNLDSREWLQLRKKFSPLQFRIPKNGVMRAIIADGKFQHMRPLFDGPTALAFHHGDLQSFAPLLQYFKKEPRCFMLGAKFENSLLTSEDFEKALALPSIQTLQGELLGLLQMPSVAVTSTLQHTPQYLLMNLDQLTKQQKEGPPSSS